MRASSSARVAAVVAALLLTFMAFSAQFSGSIRTEPEPATTYIVKQAGAPADTTVLWVDTDDGLLYEYVGGWLSVDRQFCVFGRGAVGAAGPLNVCGVAAVPSDTTTDAEQGYLIADRSLITNITALGNNTVTTPSCTLGVYADRAERKFAWTHQRETLTGGIGDSISAGDVLCAYLRASAIPVYPNTTTVVVTIRKRNL